MRRKKGKTNLGAVRRVRRVGSQDLGQVAAEKLIELAHDLGAEVEMKRGWQSYAARRMGLSPACLSLIMRGINGRHAVALVTIQRVSRKIGLSVGEILGEDE